MRAQQADGPFGARGGFGRLLGPVQRWRQRLPAEARLPLWPWILATLTIVGLLLAFHQVVRGAVERGGLVRTTAAVHADATLHARNVEHL